MARSPNQDRAHRHNGLLGPQQMMLVHLYNIIAADTTTPAAKAAANLILPMAIRLGSELRTRKN